MWQYYYGHNHTVCHAYVNCIFNSTIINGVHQDNTYIDVEYNVGLIPTHDGGEEIVNILKTNILNNGILYTDSNGRIAGIWKI